MNPLVSKLLLALALFVTQSAVSLHDIKCIDGEHESLCEVYATQDHNAKDIEASGQSYAFLSDAKPDGYFAPNSNPLFNQPYDSRAPPLHCQNYLVHHN